MQARRGVAIAWVLSRSAVSSVIVAGRTIEQAFEDNVRATDLQLSQDDLRLLNAISDPGIPLSEMDGPSTRRCRRSSIEDPASGTLRRWRCSEGTSLGRDGPGELDYRNPAFAEQEAFELRLARARFRKTYRNLNSGDAMNQLFRYKSSQSQARTVPRSSWTVTQVARRSEAHEGLRKIDHSGCSRVCIAAVYSARHSVPASHGGDTGAARGQARNRKRTATVATQTNAALPGLTR